MELVIILVVVITAAVVGGKVFGPTLKNTLTTASNKIDTGATKLIEKASNPNQVARLQNTTASSTPNKLDSLSYSQSALNPESDILYSASSSTLQPSMQIASGLAASSTQPNNVVYSPDRQMEASENYRTNNPVTSVNSTQPANTATYSNTTGTPSTTSNTSASTSGSTTYSDDYWASQPAAVQALRYMDPDLREAKATELAHQGYTIDVPIMVWNWDPKKTMELRGTYGYTWVPSALQPNITIAPGLTVPGMQPYDPNNPPAGSIAVPTQFQTGSSTTPAGTTTTTTPAGTTTTTTPASTTQPANTATASSTVITSRTNTDNPVSRSSATETSRSTSGKSR